MEQVSRLLLFLMMYLSLPLRFGERVAMGQTRLGVTNAQAVVVAVDTLAQSLRYNLVGSLAFKSVREVLHLPAMAPRGLAMIVSQRQPEVPRFRRIRILGGWPAKVS